MQSTPIKSLQSKNSSLRTQIEKKLLTDKKLDNNKQNLKKYHSHVKNANQNNFFSYSNHQSFQTTQMNKDFYENFNQFPSEKKTIQKPQIDEKTILQYESLQNPNFFGYTEWQQLNKKFFNQVDQKYVKNLWKIMRTINYGDALIPSGLIFQVIVFLISKSIIKKCSLKEIFNKFLQINNLSDRINNFRELKNYLSLEEIQRGYSDLKSNTKKRSSSKSSTYQSLTNTSTEKNVFDRNYQDYMRRNLTKNKEMHKRILQKEIDPECLFKPNINEYCPKKLFIDQSLRPSRACHSNGKWISKGLIDNQVSQNLNFKATPFQRSIMQCQSLEEIPGATQHIDRYKDSEAKKRKLNRYNLRPTQVFRNY